MASGTGESTLNEWETIVTPMLGVTISRLTLNSDLEVQLMEKRLIGFNDLQAIRNEKTDSDKKICLLHKYLYTREPGSLRRFIDALKRAGPGNESLADTLDQECRKRQNRSEEQEDAREGEKESATVVVQKGMQEAIRSSLARAEKAENENEELRARLVLAQKAESENEELKIQNAKQIALKEKLQIEVRHTRQEVYELNGQLSKIKENEKHKHIPEHEVEMTKIKLGGGAYGECKVGYWRGCFVAVKSFHEILDTNFYCRLFWQEVAVSSEFHHPNVIVMYGATLVDGRPLRIITELLEGSLADVIKAARRCQQLLSLREQIDIALGITAGINYLHQLGPVGVLHGDIRSSSILITSLMEAKVKNSVSTRFADSDVDAGPMSPEYLAPERNPERSTIHSTTMADVYSMGVTFIELMTHQHPAIFHRIEQASGVAHPIVKRLCRRIVIVDPELRPAAYECFKVLEEVHKSDEYNKCPPKRMVKGKLHGEETVTLTTEPWPKYHHTFP